MTDLFPMSFSQVQETLQAYVVNEDWRGLVDTYWIDQGEYPDLIGNALNLLTCNRLGWHKVEKTDTETGDPYYRMERKHIIRNTITQSTGIPAEGKPTIEYFEWSHRNVLNLIKEFQKPFAIEFVPDADTRFMFSGHWLVEIRDFHNVDSLSLKAESTSLKMALLVAVHLGLDYLKGGGVLEWRDRFKFGD